MESDIHDSRQFEKLYKRLQPILYAYSRKFIDDAETAKDLIQDAFLRLWEDRDAVRIHTSVNAYLVKTVHNLCLLHIRKQHIHQNYEHYASVAIKEAELNFLSPENAAYTSIFLKDIEAILQKSVEKLPPQSRRIFLMSRMENLSNVEIAGRLDISVRTVENQIFRALKMLKLDLNDYLTLFPAIYLLLN
jgi:RNA polymerase sigma-70 factor (ECF subfamily)